MSVVRNIAIKAPRKKIRDLIRSDRLIHAPGVVDAFSAKLVEGAGFDAVYVTGGGISRSMGFPGVGLGIASEMLERVRLITEAVSIPTIVDVDTGSGNAVNERDWIIGLHDIQELEKLFLALPSGERGQ